MQQAGAFGGYDVGAHPSPAAHMGSGVPQHSLGMGAAGAMPACSVKHEAGMQPAACAADLTHPSVSLASGSHLAATMQQALDASSLPFELDEFELQAANMLL
jgi:hypothetical protein